MQNALRYYWNKSRAINHLLDAVQELESLLHQLMPLCAKHATLESDAENRERSRIVDEAADREFSATFHELWALEERIWLKTDIISLMSAIQTEDHLTAFCAFNFKGDFSNFKKMGKKDQINLVLDAGKYATEEQRDIDSSFRKLKEFRDAFAHGHRTELPAEPPYLDNHQTWPKEYINIPAEFRKAIELVSAFLFINDCLCSISEHPFTKRTCANTVKIWYVVGNLKRFTFEDKGKNYIVSYSE